MSHSSARGQTTPLGALVAVAAVCLGLSLYAGVVTDVRSVAGAEPDAESTLETVVDDLAPAGVAHPERLNDAMRPGRSVNVSLAVGEHAWTVGPSPPADAERARTRLPVRVGPGAVPSGRLRVVAW
jgi:hypothetical protein